MWAYYQSDRGDYASRKRDAHQFGRIVAPVVGSKSPEDLTKADMVNLRRPWEDQGKRRTAAEAIEYLQRAVNYGVTEKLCSPPTVKIKRPTLHNEVTEHLTTEQVRKLAMVARTDENADVGAIVQVALLTGMRKGAIFNLKWSDLERDLGFIVLREGKARDVGEKDRIPYPPALDDVLAALPDRPGEEYIFPRRGGGAPGPTSAGRGTESGKPPGSHGFASTASGTSMPPCWRPAARSASRNPSGSSPIGRFK